MRFFVVMQVEAEDYSEVESQVTYDLDTPKGWTLHEIIDQETYEFKMKVKT